MKRLMLIATALAVASPLLAGNRVRTPETGAVSLVRNEPQPFRIAPQPVSSTEVGPAGALPESVRASSGGAVALLTEEAPSRARGSRPAGLSIALVEEDSTPSPTRARKGMAVIFDDGSTPRPQSAIAPAATTESVAPSTSTPVQE